ncbi:protocatechuate 3,4-dioxygenase subunit beta [Tsukamurella soli]|uniref:Protocatechuate 3,4-dioxygenase subunit beta n=1 Tax=Tsukamurella soli TaxID=644556 RepID=A0ABP8KBZ2_9ACTN
MTNTADQTAAASTLVLPPSYAPAANSNGPVNAQRDFRDYRTTTLRNPKHDLHLIPQRLTELTGPVLGEGRVTADDANLTLWNGGEAVGQRIIVHGRVLDADNRPVPGVLLEIWQANAGGRYRHKVDVFPAPLDPHFNGVGRTVTDEQGRYRFLTIKPGMYPWGNHVNAWRPAHIHFSLFGRAFTQRLVTQMYFPDDPMFFQDPIYNSVPDGSRQRMVSEFDYASTEDNWAAAYRWDIVLRGAKQSVFEN